MFRGVFDMQGSATKNLRPIATDFEGRKALYRTSMKTVRDKLVNSNLNRTVDNVRMEELKGYMQRERHMPNVLYAIDKHVPDGKLHIYDGGHRFTAASELLDKSQLDLDVWLAVRKLTREEQLDSVVKAEMHAINKRVRVPPQYTDPEAKQALKDLARDVTAFIVGTWPRICSNSDNPQIPHFNQHRLEELLYQRLFDVATADEDPVTDEQLQLLSQNKRAWLVDISAAFKDRLGPNPKGNAQKAAKKGCYLFALQPGAMDQFLDAVEAKTRASS